MGQSFAGSVVEDAALGWVASLGYGTEHGAGIAPGKLLAERLIGKGS
jgi:hypothetical protein